LKTDNIAALLALQLVTTSSSDDYSKLDDSLLDSEQPIVVVGNTHLCHRYVNARNFQAKVYLREAKEFKEKMISQYPGNRVGLVMSGDFNAGPASSIYRLFTTEVRVTLFIVKDEA